MNPRNILASDSSSLAPMNTIKRRPKGQNKVLLYSSYSNLLIFENFFSVITRILVRGFPVAQSFDKKEV